MPRRAQAISYVTGLAIVVLVLVVLAVHGREALVQYGWVLFPGIFAVAIAARAVETVHRRRRRAKFCRRR